MNFLSLVLVISVGLSNGCNTKTAPVDKAADTKIKRDQLVLKLQTPHKLENSTQVLAVLNLQDAKKEKIEVLTKSYLKSGRYQTIVLLHFHQDNFDEIKKDVENNTSVKKVMKNRIYSIPSIPIKPNEQDSDTGVEQLEFDAPHHQLIQTKKATDIARGEGIVVAVTDAGIDYNHQDLAENIWQNSLETGKDSNGIDLCNNGIDDDGNGKIDDCRGWNFAEKDNDPIPQRQRENHGTHVAGIVSSSQNGEGSVGVAPDAKVMPVRILPSHWVSTKILDSYTYAVDNGAKIINTSLELDAFFGDEVLNSALEYAEDHGVIVVNAAGNNGRANSPKLELSNILFVANTGVGNSWGCIQDVKTPDSNWGYGIDVSAPGCRINSTIPFGRYTKLSGTSMSSPVVAGALALIWSKNPDWSKEMVVSRLLTTTDDIAYANDSDIVPQLGAGRVNLARAVGDTGHFPLTIWGFTREMKTISDSFTLRLKGLADWKSLTEETIVVHLLDDDVDPQATNYEELLATSPVKIPTHIKDMDKLSYGSNRITVVSEEGKIKPGKYLLKVSASLKDPFKKPLDGNGDGISAKEDHFYKIIHVENKDHLSPVLNKIEITNNKLATPESPEVMYLLHITDDFSGFKEVSIELENAKHNRVNYVARCGTECIDKEGRVEIKIPAPALGYNGEYYVKRIKIADNSKPVKESTYSTGWGKPTHYTGPKHGKAIAIANTRFELDGYLPIDKEKPVLTANPQLAAKAQPGQKIEATIFSKDSISGVKRVEARLKSIDDRHSIDSNKAWFTEDPGEVQKVYFDLDESTPTGEYYLDYIGVADPLGNTRQYYCDKYRRGWFFWNTDIECPVISIVKE